MSNRPPFPKLDEITTAADDISVSRMSAEDFLALLNDTATEATEIPLWEDASLDLLQDTIDDPDLVFRGKVKQATLNAEVEMSYGQLPVVDLLTKAFAGRDATDAEPPALPPSLWKDRVSGSLAELTFPGEAMISALFSDPATIRKIVDPDQD
jgi:hypothetical protein